MYKQNHCCKEMNTTLNNNYTSLAYSSVFRDYGLLVSYTDKKTVQAIHYCPWCQTQLPKSCFNLWFEILKQEYKLDNPRSEEQRSFIPNEFKTNEWWIKRKL
jgi:hypothetical protein